MKTYKQQATNKLTSRLGSELKNILLEDLKNSRSKNCVIHINQQVTAQQIMPAA